MSSVSGVGLALPGVLGTDASVAAGTPAWSDLTLFDIPDDVPCLAGEVPDFSLDKMGVSVKSYLDRTTSLALAACALALDGRRDETMGLSFASRWGCLASMKLFYAKVRRNPRVAPPLPFSHSYVNSPAAVIAIEFGLKGFHAVYSHGKACALSAFITALEETRKTGNPVLTVAADSLTPERFALYNSKNLIGEPGADSPRRFVPAEGAVALLVEKDGAGSFAACWARPGPSEGNLEDTLASSLNGLPRLCYTDAATVNDAHRYEKALPCCECRHPGLSLGEAEAALPLFLVAAATGASEPVLCISGDVTETVCVKIEPDTA